MMISIFTADLRGGGAERVMLDLAQEFAREGHDVEFVLMRAAGELLPEAQRDFNIIDLAAPRVRNVVPGLFRYLRQRRPSSLIVAMWPLTVIAPIVALMAHFRGNVVVSEHAMLSQQYAFWGGLHRIGLRVSAFAGYRLATARVSVSNGVGVDMASLSCMPKGKFKTIYNPIRRSVLPAPDGLAAANAVWATDRLRILSVGNLKPEKNHSLLLRAFSKMSRTDATLVLLGQGESEAALMELASDLEIENRVVFAGFHADPSPFYATADLFVLSSDHEGFGNVIVEALSFGLSVISTDCPSGPSEILKDGQLGRLVPVGNATELAAAMDSAFVGPANRDALICRAADFAPEIAARKYLDLLGLK